MIEVRRPIFEHKRLIKTQMLNDITNYPRIALEILTDDLTNGIIAGFNFAVDTDILTISKGIFKYNNALYIVDEPVTLSYSPTQDTVLIKLTLYDEVKQGDFITQYVDIALSDAITLQENELELGRFKLKPGAYLRYDYQDLDDFVTEYNTIITVFNQYAGRKKPTVDRAMMHYFARAVLAHTGEAFDMQFAMLCLNSSRIERDVILHYIACKKNTETKEMDNGQIHQALGSILEDMKQGEKRKIRKRARDKVIFID